MDIHNAEKDDYRFIAQLHMKEIKKGFLSSLGVPFLAKLYKAINDGKGACVLVAKEHDKVGGFIAGTTDIKNLYKRILVKKWAMIMVPLMRYVWNFDVIKKIIETAMYGFKKNKKACSNDTYAAELLSLAVEKELQGRGIGKKLVMEFESFLKYNNISRYKVVTYSLDKKSNQFYTACHFIFRNTFSHHGNVMSEYTKDII